MGTLARRTISLIMSVMMVLSCFAGMAFSVGADDVSDMKKTISSMSVGDTFTYGSYPQTDVTSELGSELTAAAPPTGEWTSYNYYYDGEQSDYMKYYDLSYNGSRYRGVYFTKYRPYYWDSTLSAYQSENGYDTNNIYWFRYDPLTWRILDPSTGYVICEDIIDSQAFNNEYYTNGTEDAYGNTAYYNDKTYTHYANNWEYSTIRTWLNESFFVTAFSASERSQIPCTKLTTPAYSALWSDYDVGETGDYVFLPSYQDMLNSSYGFSSDDDYDDMNRRAHSSDYAKSQGVYVSTSYTDKYDKHTSYYRLRSAGSYSDFTTGVHYHGYVNYYWNTYDTDDGIRPALCFNPSSTAPTHVHTEVTIEGKAATCTEKGLTEGVKCSVCGKILKAQEEIPASGHKFKDGKCTVCGAKDPNYKPTEKPTVKPTEKPTVKPTEKTTVPSTTKKPTEKPTEKPAEAPTVKPTEPSTEKPTEAPTAKPTEPSTEKPTVKPTTPSTDKPTEKPTSKPAEKTTAPATEKPTRPEKPTKPDSDMTTFPAAEKPNETTTEPTTKVDEKLEFADNSNVNGKIDEENKKVSIVPNASAGMSLDDFKAMFKGAVSVAVEKIEKVFNGMKFMFGGNEYTFILKGDTSPDGKITAKDARTILRIAARLEQPDDVTKESADIDSDRKVTSKEARSVLRFAAKLQNKINS